MQIELVISTQDMYQILASTYGLHSFQGELKRKTLCHDQHLKLSVEL